MMSDEELRKLAGEIKEILICNQFAEYIEKSNTRMTAEEANTRNTRAKNFYLGATSQDDPKEAIKMNRFHSCIDGQAACIIREIRTALSEN